MPDKRVLTCRANGFATVGSDDVRPGQEDWKAVDRSARIP